MIQRKLEIRKQEERVGKKGGDWGESREERGRLGRE